MARYAFRRSFQNHRRTIQIIFQKVVFNLQIEVSELKNASVLGTAALYYDREKQIYFWELSLKSFLNLRSLITLQKFAVAIVNKQLIRFFILTENSEK